MTVQLQQNETKRNYRWFCGGQSTRSSIRVLTYFELEEVNLLGSATPRPIVPSSFYFNNDELSSVRYQSEHHRHLELF